jgi:hypothetical protein
LSGKILVALVAIAVSSASAATVGVVYTKIVEHRHVIADFSVEETAPNAGPAKNAVVLNASDNYFESFTGSSTDGDAPLCQSGSESRRCTLVPVRSDIHLRILGYTVTIPPIWLAGDSEDRYFDADTALRWPDDRPQPIFEIVRRGKRQRLVSDLTELTTQSDNGSQEQDETQGQNNSSPSSPGAETTVVELATSLSFANAGADIHLVFSFSSGGGQPSASIPIDVEPHIGRTDRGFHEDNWPHSFSSPPVPDVRTPWTPPGVSWAHFGIETPAATVPEPSTWTMMVAGFATLGVLARRRIVAALKSATRST